MTTPEMIPLKDCIERRVYRLHSRNLLYGVFDGKDGFIGIRKKFDAFYLFREYHWEKGSKGFGTVRPLEDTGIDVPKRIALEEDLQSIDQVTRRPTEFDRPVAEGGRGWYFADTGEDADQDKIRSVRPMNTKLFNFLEGVMNGAGVDITH